MASSPLRPLLAAFWSVAIPGFGQLYNGKYVKGFFFIVLEFVINLQSNLNIAIYYSWLMDIETACKVINYQWLLFYPCFYVFSIYDAYHDCCIMTNRAMSRWIGIPFVLTWMTGTVSVIVSSGQRPVFGLERLGPVFSGVLILIVILGLGSWTVSHYR